MIPKYEKENWPSNYFSDLIFESVTIKSSHYTVSLHHSVGQTYWDRFSFPNPVLKIQNEIESGCRTIINQDGRQFETNFQMLNLHVSPFYCTVN